MSAVRGSRGPRTAEARELCSLPVRRTGRAAAGPARSPRASTACPPARRNARTGCGRRASSSITTRSCRGRPAIHSCVDASRWSIIPTSGRRSRLRRQISSTVASGTRFFRERPARPSISPASPKISRRCRSRRICRGETPSTSAGCSVVSTPAASSRSLPSCHRLSLSGYLPCVGGHPLALQAAGQGGHLKSLMGRTSPVLPTQALFGVDSGRRPAYIGRP